MDYARTTVVTFVQRMHDKGYVSTYRKGNVSFVHAEVDKTTYLEKYLDYIVDFWYDGDSVCAACDVFKTMSPADKKKARKLL